MSELLARIKAFRAAEDGQSALFAALTIFCLFVTVGVMIGVGEVTTTQMRVQNAADAAAYSGAAVEADCLAQIAWINEGMAEVYYQAMKAAADNVAASTRFMLARAPSNPFWDPTKVANGNGGFLPSPAGFATGFPELSAAQNAFDAAYKRAQELNHPDAGAAVEWLARLGLIQRSIAIAAPDLIQHQICHAAQVNFYEDANRDRRNDLTARVAMFPADFSFYPEDMDRHDVVIEKLDNGWRLTSNTDPGYEFIATHTSGNGGGASAHTVDEWDFLLRYPEGDGTVEKRFTYHEEIYNPPVSSGCDGKCKNKHNRKAAYYELKCPADAYELLVTVYDDDADGASDAVVYTETKDGKTERKCLEPLDDGVIIDQQTYQWDADGYLTKNGKRVNQTTTVEVNGVKVPVSMPTWLGHIKLGSQPIEFRFDRMHCVLSGVRMDVHVYLFPAGPVHVKIDDVAVHWLHVKNCDGRWRDRDLHQKGRHFHRMKVLTPDQKWLYETITVGSYLTDMNWRKLFTRAAARHGELPAGWWYVPTGPGMPGGDPLDGDREVDGRDDDTVWDEDAAAPWSEYPEWARPARAPANSGAQQLNFGGYQDVDHGRPAACGDATVDYAFSATCPARYPTPLNPFTSRVPAALKKSLPRKVGFPRFDGNNVVIPDLGRVNPLFLLYFPKEWEAVVQNDVAASARGIPDYVNNDGNPYPGYWIEGPFYREVELSDEQRAQGLVTLEQRVLQYKAGFSGRMWLLDQESPATRVEFPCAAFRRKTAEGDLWYLVVFDPLGAVPIFRQEPRYYGTAVAFYDRNSQLPDGASDYETIARIPAMVRRTLGPGASAGRTGSVKEYLTEKNYLAEDPKHDWTVPAGMALELDDFDRGLEAMSELFRRPLVVGVHAPATFGWLAGLFGRDRDKMGQKARDMGLGNPLYVIGDEGSGYAGRKWSSGHFAFAAARVFFSAPDGGWVTNFRYGNAGAQYASSFADSMNLIKQELPGAGQKWQKSTYNLFEPSWTAALVPFNAAVRLRDLYGDVGEADFNTEDSPTSYLFRQLVRVDWRRNMADSGFGNLARDGRVSVHKITAPPRQGHHNAVNLNNSGIDAVTCH